MQFSSVSTFYSFYGNPVISYLFIYSAPSTWFVLCCFFNVATWISVQISTTLLCYIPQEKLQETFPNWAWRASSQPYQSKKTRLPSLVPAPTAPTIEITQMYIELLDVFSLFEPLVIQQFMPAMRLAFCNSVIQHITCCPKKALFLCKWRAIKGIIFEPQTSIMYYWMFFVWTILAIQYFHRFVIQ